MSVDPKLTITGIQKLQQANAKMINALKPEGARGRAVKYGLVEGHRYAAAITHVDMGALRASHRMQYKAGGGTVSGSIYIDPTTRNPVTNAMPSIYGVYEHGHGGTHSFYERVERERGKAISDGMIGILVGAFPQGG